MDKYNAEGYPDPTAFEALKNIEKQYRLIYVCSPYRGNMEYNANRARGYSRFVVTQGQIPLAPHLLFPQFLDEEDQEEREVGLSYALFLLRKCHELWVFGSKVSEGMAREIKRANKLGMPIRYFNERCQEVKGL